MLLSKSELENLAQTYDQHHVSIYLPTHRAGDRIRQNSIRFKNLLDRAEEQLVETGRRRTAADELLAPARGLVADDVFWQQQSDGLAIFLADDLTRKYRVPIDVESLVVVSDRFHLKPLLTVSSNNGRFYLLALSQHEIRLLQGTRYRMGEIDLDKRDQVPKSIVEILKWEDPEKRLQLHTGSEALLGRGAAAIFHGHGVASQDDPKQKILRYFHRLDEGISDLLAGDDAPLVLAGDELLLPLYREANGYPHLVEDGIAKQPDQFTVGELHQQAWPIVRSLFFRSREQAEEAYQHLSGTEDERVSAEVAEIAPAAAFGRVEGLFVARDDHQWGTFDRDANEVELHEAQQPGDRDLLSFAALETMLRDGRVFLVDPEDVPGGNPLAAIFRW
ncbi:MAG: hypothetical protein PVH50_05615 [Anaerolineae bacterium]